MYFDKSIVGVCDIHTNEGGNFTIRVENPLDDDYIVPLPFCAIPTLIQVLQELYSKAVSENALYCDKPEKNEGVEQ